ncbi:YwdI family protein [Niallia sp. NCCP-28]|uniref:YwdI family protein n=1 Tax=Niallia sp. NCCP-28 TaxID=2934712 RepID=UPI00207ED9CA|nr:YwdI family protein [Niallia sp. NCCP-28]GKU83719.1 hypothetical protein NCCP28_31150 [Niallia sp. NCCP-28]
MNISVQQLLMKMEDQVKEAKASESDSRIRERVHAIKSLCELILEQKDQSEHSVAYQQMVPQAAPIQHVSFSSAPQPIQTQKLNTEEGNGDSLFDF